VGLAREVDVLVEAALAAQEPAILESLDGLTDAELAHSPLLSGRARAALAAVLLAQEADDGVLELLIDREQAPAPARGRPRSVQRHP
jgi:hypothetical protein